MKSHIDFYFMEFVAEWDEELAELVRDTPEADLVEHKSFIMRSLVQVLDLMVAGEYTKEDIATLLSTFTWLNLL